MDVNVVLDDIAVLYFKMNGRVQDFFSENFLGKSITYDFCSLEMQKFCFIT